MRSASKYFYLDIPFAFAVKLRITSRRRTLVREVLFHDELSSLGMSYPPLLVKVSQSRTGQDASILELAPGLLSKGEGQLISRKGEQVSEFAHQIGFRQSLGCKRMVDSLLASCPRKQP